LFYQYSERKRRLRTQHMHILNNRKFVSESAELTWAIFVLQL